MKKIKSESGQSLVELAVSLVVILWLLAGAVEFGIAFFQQIQLRDAAQEGALYGSLNPGTANHSAIEARVKYASSSPINLANDPSVSITIEYPDGTCQVEDGIRVTVSYPHKIFMPFATLFTNGNKTITLKGVVEDTILNSTSTSTSTCP